MISKYDTSPIMYLIQKESLTLNLTIKDSQGLAVNLSSATLQLTVKEKKTDTTYLITVEDASFNKTLATTGKISCPISSTNLNIQGEYWVLLKVTFSETNIKKGYFRLFIDASEE